MQTIIDIWNISQNHFFLTGSIEVEVTDTSKVYINIMVSFQQKSQLKSSQRTALQRNTIQHHPSYSPRWMPPLLNKLLFTTTKMIWNMKSLNRMHKNWTNLSYLRSLFEFFARHKYGLYDIICHVLS